MSEKIKYRVNDQGITEYSDDDGSDCCDGYSSEDYFSDTTFCGIENQPTPKLEKLEDLPWFHSGMTRNTCEALLLSNGVEGTYLLRKSDQQGRYTVSVRCKDSIKHYALDHQLFNNSYSFGMGNFDSLQELVEHFKCMPVLGSESGPTVTLQFPYKNNIPEPSSYEKVTRHAELGKTTGFSTEMPKNTPDLHIASKEGYLIKRGAIHKNWKKRWFVLQKNLLKYFAEKDEPQPIRVINLTEAIHAVEDFIDGRKNCFRLSVPNRIFYFVASTPSEAKAWIELLQWKIEYYKDRKKNEPTALSNSLRCVGEVGEHAAYLGQYTKQ